LAENPRAIRDARRQRGLTAARRGTAHSSLIPA